jgi:hypothetical protein
MRRGEAELDGKSQNLVGFFARFFFTTLDWMRSTPYYYSG